MSANRFSLLSPGLRTIAVAALCCAALWAASAHAAGLKILLADDTATHAQFVRQLRDSQGVSGTFELVRISASGSAMGSANGMGATEDSVTTGIRTRGIRHSAPAAEAPLTMAVGVVAARAAIERRGSEALVLAMLSRLDYESIKNSPAMRRADRPVGVLLREPAMADQLALIDAVLPSKRRLGVIATTESEPILQELRIAAEGWNLQVEYAPDAKSLASALRLLVARSDALLVLPDLIGDSQAATLAVLRAGAGAGLPVFGMSDGLVRSGGLAAAVSTTGQLANQALALAQKVRAAQRTGDGGALVEAATPAAVRVNANVARGLGLRLPDEQELTDRVTAIR